ncbi:B3 domain-containing transcription factor VRN1 [Lathyrus oleraceus]|nr:B3 domain-containing transcription factor VRN1-like [Pisum sativum]
MHRCRRKTFRPSAPEMESKHFMKAILPSPIHAKQIRIPEEFITRFGNELNNVATITVPDGRVWEMELKKCGKEVYFCKKWQEFAEYYCIGYGCYLCFKYEGKSKFSVVIFDITSVEISYPPSTHGEITIKCPSHRKSSKVETIGVQSMSNTASKRAEHAANEFNSSRPHFLSKINKGKNVYVAADFAAKYLKPNVPMKLQNCHGEQWEVFGMLHDVRLSLALQIRRGFSKFQRDNSLSEGDICVFELINEKPVVLNVAMFRAVDYGD